jgi:hypothetical protein
VYVDLLGLPLAGASDFGCGDRRAVVFFRAAFPRTSWPLYLVHNFKASIRDQYLNFSISVSGYRFADI